MQPPDDRLSLLQLLLDALPVGVVTLDRSGRVVHFNRAEERLARRSRERALGRDFFSEIAPCMDVKELAGLFRDRIGREVLSTSIEFSFAYPFLDGPRDVVVHMRSLDVRGVPYATLIIEDISEQRASQRMQRAIHDLLIQDPDSPIANILAGCGYLIQGAPQLDGRALATVGEIAQSADSLQGMLMNLLDISRLESGAMPVRLEQRPVLPLLQSVAAASRGHALRSRVRLEVDAEEPDIEAAVDQTLFGRMIDSLLDNAIRQSPPDTRVSLRLQRAEDDQIAIEVADEGPPLPAELWDLVFEKFSRIQDGLARSDNRGLGLTFVKLAARAHGGEVDLSSRLEGGTVFRVVLPRPEPATDFMRIRSIDPSA